jgi:predicted protein tyrosine phosphatase
MQTHVFWIGGVTAGRLGILSRPRGGDWLLDEATAWRNGGIDLVVSLLEPEEATDLMLDAEAVAATAAGVGFIQFPIPDRGVPAAKESAVELGRTLAAELGEGRSVVVHCRQGIGRSGLIAAMTLMALGHSAAVAVAAVSDARGLSVPETPKQRQWIEDLAAWLP